MTVSAFSACSHLLNNSLSLLTDLRKSDGDELAKFGRDPLLSQLSHLNPVTGEFNQKRNSAFDWVTVIKSTPAPNILEGASYIAFRALGIFLKMNNNHFAEYAEDRLIRHQELYFGTSSRLVQCCPEGSPETKIFTTLNRCRERITTFTFSPAGVVLGPNGLTVIPSGLMLLQRTIKDNGKNFEDQYVKYPETIQDIYAHCCEFLKIVSQDDKDAALCKEALQATPIAAEIHPIILECLGMNGASSLGDDDARVYENALQGIPLAEVSPKFQAIILDYLCVDTPYSLDNEDASLYEEALQTTPIIKAIHPIILKYLPTSLYL